MSWSKNVSPVGWYVGSYILRFVEIAEKGSNESTNSFLTWENTILVKAESLDEAYDKIIAFASLNTRPYKGGPLGVDVRWLFEGVTELLPIYEDIADGSEIMWAERRESLPEIRERIRPKGNFGR